MIRIFLSLFILPLILFAQETLVINDSSPAFFDFTLGVYEDKNSSLTIETIQKVKIFSPASNKISNGYSHASFWYTFNIKNETKSTVEYYLKSTENFIDKLDCYVVSEDHSYVSDKEGPGYFIDGQKNLLKKPAFAITLQPNETKHVYIRMFSIFPSMTSFYILNKEDLHTYVLEYQTYYSLYIGAVLALILYNLFIFFFSQNIAYLYYVLYAAPFLSWQMRMNGFFPFDTFSSSTTFYLHGLLTPFFIAFIIFFSREVLDTKKLFPKIDKVVLAMGFFYLLLTVASIFDIHRATAIATAFVPIVLPFLLFIGFKSYFTGNKTALFYIVAQLIFLTTSIMFSMTVNGHLNYTLLTRHGLVLGSTLEMILFSLALAYKIKALQNEKIEIINRANAELDFKIQERTKELERSKDELKELASRDPMTGLNNRRSFFEISEELLHLARREAQPITIIMFDLDNFKNINDTYGHAVGDQVITNFASLLKSTRSGDVPARFGGEEFVLLLPNTNKERALNIANNIRIEAEEQNIQVDDSTLLSYSVSGGIGCCNVENDHDIHKALHQADKNLYQAKNSGKNTIGHL